MRTISTALLLALQAWLTYQLLIRGMPAEPRAAFGLGLLQGGCCIGFRWLNYSYR